jgi:hypothetical protein
MTESTCSWGVIRTQRRVPGNEPKGINSQGPNWCIGSFESQCAAARVVTGSVMYFIKPSMSALSILSAKARRILLRDRQRRMISGGLQANMSTLCIQNRSVNFAYFHHCILRTGISYVPLVIRVRGEVGFGVFEESALGSAPPEVLEACQDCVIYTIFPRSSSANQLRRWWFSGKIHRCHAVSMSPGFDSRPTQTYQSDIYFCPHIGLNLMYTRHLPT